MFEHALWSDEEDPTRPLVVLLHGHHGTEQDMARLFPYLPEGSVGVSLRAPFPHGNRFTWFLVPPGSPDATVEHAAPTADALAAWLDTRRGAGRPIAAVGFSQGGAIALQTLRRHPSAFAAVAVLSTFLPVGKEKGDGALARRRPPVFWGRGLRDGVILDRDVDALETFLPAHARLTVRTYAKLRHAMDEVELRDVAEFLLDAAWR